MTDYRLSIEEERIVLAAEPPVVLSMGWRTIARESFRHHPPSPLDLENAIAAIEDEIARAKALPEAGSRVRTENAFVREIALAAGLPRHPETVLTVTAVEQAFQRLAAQAERGVRPADGLPQGNEAAAALVILRELMHHLGFAALVVIFPAEPRGRDSL